MGIKSFIRKKLVKVEKEKIIVPTLQGAFIEGRKALITGGSSGIGYAIAEAFIANGANVTICGRSVEKLKEAQGHLCEKCNCSIEKIDILSIDISNVDEMKKKLHNYLNDKRIDIFVNNAGTNGGQLFPDTLESDYDRILNTNLKGMYFISQEIARYMIDNKIEGNILNVTSSSSLRPGISPYILSKWGERSLTLGMAKKYLPYNIIVNGLAPGSTFTPMLISDKHENLNLEWAPNKRYGTPEEIGNLAVILVSNMGRLIVGDTIYATGGAGVITFDDATY